jgi:hypothetical protein
VFKFRNCLLSFSIDWRTWEQISEYNIWTEEVTYSQVWRTLHEEQNLCFSPNIGQLGWSNQGDIICKTYRGMTYRPYIRNCDLKPEKRPPLAIPRLRSDDNIKVVFIDIGLRYYSVDWIELARDRAFLLCKRRTFYRQLSNCQLSSKDLGWLILNYYYFQISLTLLILPCTVRESSPMWICFHKDITSRITFDKRKGQNIAPVGI